MGRQGIRAVKTPAGLVPRPMLAVSSKLAFFLPTSVSVLWAGGDQLPNVQFSESIP